MTTLFSGDQLYASGASWTVTAPGATSWAPLNSVCIRDGSGRTVMSHRLITVVTAATTLGFYPPVQLPQSALTGTTYRIETCPRWRLQYLSFYEAERYI